MQTISRLGEKLLASQKGLCSIALELRISQNTIFCVCFVKCEKENLSEMLHLSNLNTKLLPKKL
jgi:hypothetical protein